MSDEDASRPGPAAAGPRVPVSGVFLTLGVIVILELLDATALRITAPGVALVLAVAYTAYRSGLRPGLISALLAAAYIYYEAWSPASNVGFFATPTGRLLLVGGVLVGVAVIVGSLRSRLTREIEREREQRRIAETREHQLERVLESIGEGFFAFDRDWRIRYANHRAETMFGRSRDELVGQVIWELYPIARASRAYDLLTEAVRTGEPVEFDEEYREAGRWFEVRGYPMADGIAVYFRDVTTVRRSRRMAEQSQRLLADTGAALTGTLEVRAMLDALGRVLVPGFADALVVTLRDENGTMHRLTPFAVPPDAPLTEALPPGAETSELVRRAAGSGEAIVLDDTPTGDALDAVGTAGYRSAVLVPLAASGRTRGTLLLLCRASNGFDPTQVQIAMELAHRAGFALENLRLYESALVANQAKSDFLAVMSHELRTPLTTVMGYTDLMLSGLPEPLPQAAERYAQRVRMAAWHLLAIIEQILVYTRLEVGTETLQPERISVMDVLHDAASLIEPVAREKGVEFVLEPPDHAIAIETDLTKLRQILLNLLSNAVRFTDEGSVRLEARASGDVVEFIVEDTGIGIATDDLERIFDPFWQVDQSATRRVGGTGLGLSVARRLARMLGGDIAVTSTPGAGTRFVVTLALRHNG